MGLVKFRETRIGNCVLYQGDCMEILPLLGAVDAVVTDPPYGIGMDGGNVGYKGFNNFTKKGWDVSAPEKAVFDSLEKMSKAQIYWGGNYFGLRGTRCMLIWDKGEGFKGRTFAECEIAWTSLDENSRVFKYDPLAKGDYRGKEHPTQKPVAVMEWCLRHVADAQSILDPFMGSGTTGVACIKMGRKFVGIERDAEYFAVACERIRRAYNQPDMFQECSL